ncbi:hypothetical protein JCM33374_g6363 [Metschnikowia sp. JCM 33374]|nr:hypothetical protein JCM33374_g6363 [Metschnikowia sp. JCM 33374]
MFDPDKKAEGLDSSTFDIVKIDSFHNTRFSTLLSFLWVWIILILKFAILGSDTYTCVSILVFNRWSSSDYDVYEYKVAKWVFTGCIFFRFILLAYQIAWGIHIYRTRNIALAYLNNHARLMYAVRHYDYQCLFHEINQEGFFEWACFHVYTELDNALEVLVADLPRQVINFMTLRYYATGGELNNDILANIKWIATTNLRLSVILSFQLCTILLFLFFFFNFLLAIILYIPIKVKIAHKGFRSLKAFCYKSVNEKVRFLVRRNHKPRTQILNEGVMDIKEIRANPLLSSNSTFDTSSLSRPSGIDVFSQRSLNASKSSITDFHDHSSKSRDLTRFSSKESLNYVRNAPSHSLEMSNFPENPFADSANISIADRENFNNRVMPHGDRFIKREVNPFGDPCNHVASPPQRILPVSRSQASESVVSQNTTRNLMYKPDYSGENENKSQASSLGTIRDASMGSNMSFANDNSSKTRLLYQQPLNGASSIQESSVSSEISSSVNSKEPDYTKPDYTKPDYTKPDYTKPDYTKPDYTKPDYTKPDYIKSGCTVPFYSDPGYTDPGYADPYYTDHGCIKVSSELVSDHFSSNSDSEGPNQPDDMTPYPVRGVSQYFGHKNDA